jgi:hypothetical protein
MIGADRWVVCDADSATAVDRYLLIRERPSSVV